MITQRVHQSGLDRHQLSVKHARQPRPGYLFSCQVRDECDLLRVRFERPFRPIHWKQLSLSSQDAQPIDAGEHTPVFERPAHQQRDVGLTGASIRTRASHSSYEFERNVPFAMRCRPFLCALSSQYPDPEEAVRASPPMSKRNLQQTFQVGVLPFQAERLSDPPAVHHCDEH